MLKTEISDGHRSGKRCFSSQTFLTLASEGHCDPMASRMTAGVPIATARNAQSVRAKRGANDCQTFKWSYDLANERKVAQKFVLGIAPTRRDSRESRTRRLCARAIKEECFSIPRRVFFDTAKGKPLSPRDAEAKFGLKPGRGAHVIETNVPAANVERTWNSVMQVWEYTVEGEVPLSNPAVRR